MQYILSLHTSEWWLFHAKQLDSPSTAVLTSTTMIYWQGAITNLWAHQHSSTCEGRHASPRTNAPQGHRDWRMRAWTLAQEASKAAPMDRRPLRQNRARTEAAISLHWRREGRNISSIPNEAGAPTSAPQAPMNELYSSVQAYAWYKSGSRSRRKKRQLRWPIGNVSCKSSLGVHTGALYLIFKNVGLRVSVIERECINRKLAPFCFALYSSKKLCYCANKIIIIVTIIWRLFHFSHKQNNN